MTEAHPAVRAAMRDLEAAQADREAARGRAVAPRLALELGGSANHDLDGVRGLNGDRFAMLRLRYNLFSGGRDNARGEQTAYLINSAKDVRDRTQREVTDSEQLSWNAYTVAKDQLEHLKMHVDASEQADLRNARYFPGQASTQSTK